MRLTTRRRTLMSENNTTPFSDRCNILADLWMNYRQDDQFADFVEYNDLGLPLAYLLAESVVKPTEIAETFVNETFELLLSGLNIEDTGFDILDDLLGLSGVDE